ncbi:MAG: hypothetical protein GF383_09800, partial [Candidatus Lokiarchaeota archaeon]|nr:hypothetical protein [Candidatus Lokiarchaeota archaeon]MBD3340817.1 hypothetical protein [Candidatus Lokiarchaeota archaeon]
MQRYFKSEKFFNINSKDKERIVVLPYKCSKALSPAKGYIAYKNRVNFTANPYYGCLYDCKYCFVPKSLVYNHLKIGRDKWGNWILPKVNYPKLLKNELQILDKKSILEKTVIRLCSISDPFPPIEPKYLLTKKSLVEFIQHPPKWIFIQTKSKLINKYLSLLLELKDHIAIAITVTSNREEICKEFEPNSPSFEERLNILKLFKDNGFYVQAVVAPILPQDPEYMANKLKSITDRV